MSKRIKTITMADLGNHVACYDCKHKDKRIAELEKELASKNSNEVVKKKYDSLKEAIKFLWEKVKWREYNENFW